VLSAEAELGITAGLQDRVIQVYGGLVYMDFERGLVEQHGHGRCARAGKARPLHHDSALRAARSACRAGARHTARGHTWLITPMQPEA